MRISKTKKAPEKITFKTKPSGDDQKAMLAQWWTAKDERQLAAEVCGVASYLKTAQQYRMRQIAVDVRLYSGLDIYSYAGSSVQKFDKTKTLPPDRPSFNLIQACIDTLVSRLSQNEPQPKFLTDNADYKQRHLAQELNQFILGEFYESKAYHKGVECLRDGFVSGCGALKVYWGEDNKVQVDRVMIQDLFVDDNDALNGDPQSLVQLKLMDRDRLIANNPKFKASLAVTPQSYPDNSPDTGRTTTDQVMVTEAWKLPSSDDPETPNYIPGRHVIATTNCVLLDEPWEKPKFPFVFFNYSNPFLGFWGQGIATQLFGTQLAINRIMYTITRAINLVGVPRIFVEQSSKVVKAHNNNELGVVITFSGTKPSYEVAPCNAPELYEERDKLIEYGFRQCGVSNLQATSQKPAGLNSGEALRSYDDINSDRFAYVQKKYEQLYIDLAYQIIDVAMDIAKETGKYQTVYPNKDGTKEISLPQMDILQNPFVIQCFSESSLPRQPAGRIAKVTELVQAGILTLREGRRLMHVPDLESNEKLDNASEERIFQTLDKIVQKGEFTRPDIFIDFDLATTLTVQYINLYAAAKLEPEKMDKLVDFFNAIQEKKQMGQPPMQPQAAPTPQARPMPQPVSPLVPNGAAAA